MKKFIYNILKLICFTGIFWLYESKPIEALVIDGVDYPMSMHVLDVGKGDSIYVNCDDKHILIDAGERAMGNRVVSALRNLGVTHLDEVIVTHYHSDHYGGMAQVFQAFSVGKVILPNCSSVRPAAFSIPTGIPTEIGGADHNLGQLHLKKLTPIQPIAGGHNPNDESQIWKVTFGSKSFLFTGDAEIAERNALLNQFGASGDLQADVLKVPHHGDSSVTNAPLLNAVQPSYAVISTTNAFMSSYNNLTQITAAFNTYRPTFMANNVKQTYSDGNITYATDGTNISVRSRRNSQQTHNHGGQHTIPLYDPIPGRNAGGSNDNGWYKGIDGKNYLVKFTRGSLSNQEIANRAANELIAIKLYRQMGVNIPDARLIQDTNGRIGIAVEERQIQDVHSYNEIWNLTGLQEGFAVDCFLGNWDVIGSGLGQNLCRDLLDSTNSAIRIDAGGSLLYRAKGTPKGASFSNQVQEFKTFFADPNRPAAQSFKKITLTQLEDGLNRIIHLSEIQIEDIVNTYGRDMAAAVKNHLINTLKARRRYVQDNREIIVQTVSNEKVRLGEAAFIRATTPPPRSTPPQRTNTTSTSKPKSVNTISTPQSRPNVNVILDLKEFPSVFRVYNLNNGLHHYTTNWDEVQCLVDLGWNYENLAFKCSNEGVPIYRLYNKNDGNHHYTMDENERNYLISIGWVDEGTAFCALLEGPVPVHRAYNPGNGEHFYTTNYSEIENAVNHGWNYEGIAWFTTEM
ncbi:MAG: MBL fold metallo-hydrolase [Lactobacillales bacterium]|jgi:beta-lactamase superfamily II metal-dependent hydrolase|nr:MBL fold metallo-hydrolase [Lactobacillales bacterium]